MTNTNTTNTNPGTVKPAEQAQKSVYGQAKQPDTKAQIKPNPEDTAQQKNPQVTPKEEIKEPAHDATVNQHAAKPETGTPPQAAKGDDDLMSKQPKKS